MKIILIDNYDSFTFNLFHYLSSLKINVDVIRNDKITSKEIIKTKYNKIVISPGPGNPNQSGNCLNIVKSLYKDIPILGICLGHQLIGHYFKCKIVVHEEIFHGKVSNIINNRNDTALYKDIPDTFQATRYHSLVIDKSSIGDELIITSELSDSTIMGLKHRKYPLFGIQYHPESIGTKFGKKIIRNFILNV